MILQQIDVFPLANHQTQLAFSIRDLVQIYFSQISMNIAIFLLVNKFIQMQNQAQIDDNEATLSLAKQIGMKAGYTPLCSLPFRQLKYTAMKRKIFQKYIQNGQLNKSNTYSPRKIQTSQNKRRTHSNHLIIDTSRKSTMHQSFYKQNSQQKGQQNEQNRAETARTSFRNRSKLSSRFYNTQNIKKFADLQSKNLLLDIWRQQTQKKFNLTPQLRTKIINNSSIQKKSNNDQRSKSRKKSIKIKYNSLINSFQFF